MATNEVSFSLGDVSEAPKPPQSGLAEIVDGNVPPVPPSVAVVTGRIVEEPEPEPVPTPAPEDLSVRAQVAKDKLETTMSSTPVSTYKRAKRFHADTPFVLGLLLLLITAMAGASFYVSFSGLYAAAAWAVGDNPPLQFAVPVMLDISIIAFTLALFIERERGDKVWGTWMAISAFTVVSATANVFHTFAVSTAVDVYELAIGAVISGGAPLLLAFATDKIAVKVFQEAEKVKPVGK